MDMDSDEEGSLSGSLASDATEAWEFASDADDETQPPLEVKDHWDLYKSMRIDPACEIRTVQILPGTFGEDIVCELEVVPKLYLEICDVEGKEVVACYSYEALCYSWGSWDDHKWIDSYPRQKGLQDNMALNLSRMSSILREQADCCIRGSTRRKAKFP